MKRTPKSNLSPFVPLMVIIFLVLLAVWVPLKMHIARTTSRDPVADGTRLSVFVTNELAGYREPCG